MTVLNTATAVRHGPAIVSRVYAGPTLVWPPGLPVLMAYHQDWPAWGSREAFSGLAFVRVQQTGQLGAGHSQIQNPTIGDWVEHAFDVAAGTFTLTTLWRKVNLAGIATVTIDGVTIGTVDQYSATDTSNNVVAFAGIALGAGRHLVRLTITGKNPTATGYFLLPQWLSLDRTGA